MVESFPPAVVHAEVAVVFSDVLIFTAALTPNALVAQDEGYVQNWILDSGARVFMSHHIESGSPLMRPYRV